MFYKYKFIYDNGFLVLYKKKTLFGMFTIHDWVSQTYPFEDVKTLNNICKRRGINKIVIE